MLDVGHEKLVSVDVLTNSEKRFSVEVHVGVFLVIVGKEGAISKNELETVIEKAILVQSQDQPGKSLISWLYIFKLGVDV